MVDEADSDGSGDSADESDDLLDEKYKSLTDDFGDVAIGGLPPIAPDGGFIATSVGIGAPVPGADPARFICLRGPCVHYWERETFYASGNPKETWGEDGLRGPDGTPIRMPRQVDRTCLAHPGTETELTDELVYQCSRWAPISWWARFKRDRARRRYYKNYPDHDPSFVPAERLRRH